MDRGLTLEEAQAHPMWETQVELEMGMLRLGADRMHDQEVRARTKEQMTRLQPVRGLINDWLPRLSDAVKDWVRTMKRARGVRPAALDVLQEVDPEVAALVALRCVLDGMASERVRVATVATEIGRTLEHEQKVRVWERQHKGLYKQVQKRLTEDGASATHRARVNLYEFNRLLREGQIEGGWSNWGSEMQFRVGVVLIDCLIRCTAWFGLEPDPNHWNPKQQPPLLLVPRPGLTKWIEDALHHRQLLHPEFRPTVIPPRRWDGTRSGGYWTPYVKTPRLIRFKAHQEDQQERAADEYDALDMPLVYEAVHFLQDTSWRINRRVYDVLTQLVARDMGEAGLPVGGELEMPKRTPEVEAGDKEALKKWKRAKAEVIRQNLRRVGKYSGLSRVLLVAKDYLHFDRFYYPHMLDFRGRMYPVAGGLQPQANDVARGLLEFAEGKPVRLSDGSADWLALQITSAWGLDKWDMQTRIDWVHDNVDMFRAISADPLGDMRWADADTVDKPFQALAAIFDWVGYLEHGEGYLSHAAIQVDGTCNGIQHLSAMTLDEVAGAHVNLVPGDAPRDIYKHVAGLLQETLERIAEGQGSEADKANWWLDLCGHDLPRTLTKRQVMVIPYGGTRDSFFTYTRKWLDENHPLPDNSPKEVYKERSQRVAFLVTHLWDTCKEVVKGGMEVMEWLQKCAKAAAIGNQPIFWVTPSGFVVRHFYGKVESKKVDIKLDGERVQLRLAKVTKELDTKSQLQGIAPNFVHSLDAAALVLAIKRAKAAGITHFSAIHDAYGTHAADMNALFGHLREAFVEVHETNVLAAFRNSCASVITAYLVAQGHDPLEAAQMADERLPPLPATGNLNLRDVLKSPYFFA